MHKKEALTHTKLLLFFEIRVNYLMALYHQLFILVDIIKISKNA